MGDFVIAVDVGTGSARAGLVDRTGSVVARASWPIALRRSDAKSAEHSSTDIWEAVSASVRAVLKDAAVSADRIDAIGFDATCSLTVLDQAGQPLGVAQAGGPEWDTIVWLDHRAEAEAAILTAGGGPEIEHAGGVLSPEMQMPKLMWLKRNRPDLWARTGYIGDLADFLTFRASGSRKRSLSTLAAKWSLLAGAADGWRPEFLKEAGLADLRERAGIDLDIVPPGRSVGTLTEEAATSLGLLPGTRVAAGMVDAYAGILALIGDDPEANDTAGLIGGTSSCVMRFQGRPRFIPSFWGPYFGAALADHWIIEGGQSATGALLDHIIRIHGGGLEPSPETHSRILDQITMLIAEKGPDFAGAIHVLPDFHGNRSPIGDPGALGAIHGLSLDSSPEALCGVYYRTMVAVALGVRQILDAMEEDGRPIRRLHLGGGHVRNPLLARLYADATQRQVQISAGEEAMLLGTAMAAASAAGWHPSLVAACRAMRRPSSELLPDPALATKLERDYRIFLRMQDHRREIVALGGN